MAASDSSILEFSKIVRGYTWKMSYERIRLQWSFRFPGFKATKTEHLYIYSSEFCQLFRSAYFKECILMAASTIYFFNIFLLSWKIVSTTVGLLQNFQNVLLRNSKLLIRPHLDHDDVTHDQAYNLAFH